MDIHRVLWRRKLQTVQYPHIFRVSQYARYRSNQKIRRVPECVQVESHHNGVIHDQRSSIDLEELTEFRRSNLPTVLAPFIVFFTQKVLENLLAQRFGN